MKNEKTNKFGRRILSFLLTVVLVIGLMPGNVMTVRAEEIPSKPLSVTAFATPEQLMSSDNFALHTDTGSGTAQKVYFGTNGSNKQTWYIAGSDATDSIVLLCNPSLPMATGTMFEDDKENNKTYSADWRCTYETTPNEVYPNYYGASDLREVLQEYTSNDNTEKFSAAEKELMQSTKVYTDDDKRKDEGETDYTYYTEDVLYPAYGDYDDDKFITVGANSAESLNGGLKVSLTSAPYNRGGVFWLRAPGYYFSYEALIANPGYVGNKYVYLGCSVVPAFRLNLSSVLFASAATAATSGASLTGTMTFRVDGDDKITSQASYSTDNVIVDAAEEETVYLYVQGKDGTTDWVYSQEVSADTTIATGTIKSGAKDSNGSAVSLTSVDLSQCEIWIEKKVTDDNLVYAVMAKEIETIATVAVTDITAPVAGAELDVAATCNTTGVSTTTPTVSYTKNGESVFGNAAGYLAGYIATVELEAAGDYTFTDETTATINGEAASVSYDADTGKLTVSYTFKTAKLPLGNAYYVTKDELMSSFDLDGTDDTVGKVYFGTNGSNKQTWYIAGSDAADSIVLLCDPSLPMATGTMFENDWQNNKTYSADWRCTYGTSPSDVYPNHYGASDLREVLQEYTSNDNTEKFSAAEKELMQSTKVYTDDDKRKDEGETDYTYYTEDVLYPAYGDYDDDKFITVGANSAESLNGGLKVSLKSAPYNGGDSFWLRAPRFSDGERALVATPGFFVSSRIVNSDCSVVPAFRLNLSSVLFASAATAATSDASLTDTMTFRVDDTEKIKSKAAYTTCGVTVNYDEGDGNVFLYVQDADSVYSVEITEDTTLALSDMTGIESLTAENTKIWLEKSEDNVAYALMAEAVLTEHIPNEDDGDCTTSITCSVCGMVTTEAKAEHTPNADDGNCTTPVTCSVCGKVTTEAKPHIDENSDEYCDNCGAIYDGIGAHLAGYSVSLNGSIGVNFHMDLTQDVLDDNEAYMLFTLPNGTTQKVMVSDAKTEESAVIEGKTYYIFTCNVAAKEMTDTIQAQLITSDGSKTQVYEYSVREYADRILSGSYDDETIELVKAMLHYGAYSQEWFDYNTTNLANAGLDTLDLSKADDWDDFNPSISNNDKVGSFTSAYLTLESDTAINLKFKLADGVSFEDLRVVVQDPMLNVVPVTIDTTENVCLITLTGIKASDLDTTYSFCVTDGKGNESVILYSAMSYACAVANSEMDQKLKDVTAALRIFNLRANEKFEH